MASLISHAALPQLADLSVRCVTLPMLGAMWSGGRWGWALTVFFIWHFVVFVPSLGLSPSNAAGPFAHFDDETGKAIGYYVIWPSIAVGSAWIGALMPTLLALPKELFPFGHLFAIVTKRKLSDSTVVTLEYAIAMAVTAFLVVMGSWLPYEFIVAYIGPNAAPQLLPVIFGSAAGPGLTLILGVILFYGFTGKRDHEAHIFKHTTGIFSTIAKLFMVATFASAPHVIVAYFERDFDITWITAGSGVVLLLVLALVLFTCKCIHDKKKELDETTTHATDDGEAAKHATDDGEAATMVVMPAAKSVMQKLLSRPVRY